MKSYVFNENGRQAKSIQKISVLSSQKQPKVLSKNFLQARIALKYVLMVFYEHKDCKQ